MAVLRLLRNRHGLGSAVVLLGRLASLAQLRLEALLVQILKIIAAFKVKQFGDVQH